MLSLSIQAACCYNGVKIIQVKASQCRRFVKLRPLSYSGLSERHFRWQYLQHLIATTVETHSATLQSVANGHFLARLGWAAQPNNQTWRNQEMYCTSKTKTRNPKVIWEQPRRQPSLLWKKNTIPLRHVDPIWYTHPSTDATHHPNGIQIQSTVLPQYTLRSDRHTNTWDWRQVYIPRAAYA